MNNQWINFFDISYKFQILAILVVAVIVIDFVRSLKLPLRSTKVFGCMLAVCLFNLVSDIVTYFTLINHSFISQTLNRFLHIMFIGSIELIAVMLFLYVFYLSGAQKRLSALQMAICLLPFVVAAAASSFAPIYYEVDENGAYSHGPMVTILYVAIAVYIGASYVILLRKNTEKFHADVLSDYRKAKISIAVGLSMVTVMALVQLITKYVLISAVGICLMVLYIYIRFENPSRYIDEETDTLNRSAFHIMVPEMLARKKTFWLVAFSVDENEQISKSMGYEQMKVILRSAAEKLKDIVPRSMFFHTGAESLTMFITDPAQLEALLKRTGNGGFEVEYGSGKFTPQYHLTVIECPKYASTSDEVYDTLEYVLSCRYNYDNGNVFYVDESTIKDANYRKNVLAVLTKAVQNKAFDVVYQPIYSVEDKRFSSAEALVRLQDCGELGFISPEIFIPMAEEQGMIDKIGGIVFEKVCGFASKNKLWEKGIKYIEVNLSGMQCVNPSLPAQLTSVMQKYGIEPKFINLEITETASVDGGELLDANMDRLRSLGCHFSMDDFGTGYSNLSKMAQVKFELVKLDKSLVWPAFGENSKGPMVILNNCISMILQLGSHIVAEGVETKEQADYLTQRGVTYLQGYYFSKPIPEGAFLEKISAQYQVNASS